MAIDLAAPLARSYKFNPAFQTDSEAVKGFVVRRHELNHVLDVIRSNTGAPHNKHVLVTAPRGAGKTTLVRRVLAEVRMQDDLSRSWFPIFLAEESYTITTPGEFFLECLFHLQDQLKQPEWQRAYEEARAQIDEKSLLRVAHSKLQHFAREQRRRLLLIVENFHMIISEQIGNDAVALQDVIDADPSCMVLATSVKNTADSDADDLSALRNYQMVPLMPLDISECQALWASLTNQDVKQERIRPLQILTGGSPRLMRIMAEFTVAPSLQNLMENLNLLIDQNTEYFKSQLDSLPPTERKVFAALLDLWDPCTAKEVADNARINVNTASAMLGRLTDRGSVIKLPGKGRSASYHAAERLFNIYYLMRRRSHPSNRVRALVAFMTQYYRGDELIDTTARLVAEACALTPQNREDYHSAFSAILAQSPTEIRDKILRQTPKDFLSAFSHGDDLLASMRPNRPLNVLDSRATLAQRRTIRTSPRLSSGKKLLANVRGALVKGNSATVEQLIQTALAQATYNADFWFNLALLLPKEGYLETAIQAARKAVSLEPSSATMHTVLAWMLNSIPDAAAEVTEHVKIALEYEPENPVALTLVGDIKHAEKELQAALECYRKAWSVAPDFEPALINLASILGFELDQRSEAEGVLREGIKNHPDWHDTRDQLAHLLVLEHREEEAEVLLRDGLAVAEDSSRLWADFGQFLYRFRQDFEGAKHALHRAIELGAVWSDVWSTYARTLQITRESESEAVAAAKKATELEPTSPEPWLALGGIYSENGDLIQAENSIRKAIEIEEDSAYGWFSLGLLMQKNPGRTVDAEEAFRRALSCSDRYPCTVPKELAALLIHKGNDKDAALVLQQALAINKECHCGLLLLAGIASRSGDVESAKAHFEQALELNPESIEAVTGLARLLVEQGRDLEAAQQFLDRAVAVAPDDPHVLVASARLKRGRHSEVACLDDLRKAVAKDPRFSEAKLLLASVEASMGNVEAALAHIAEALPDLAVQRELLASVVDAAVMLAKQGQAQAMLEVIHQASVSEYLEPLSVALQLLLGEKPRVAKEILEVAGDILAKMI